jgi:ABC-type Fe3+/spermidine/putrescine transport system ATPase subunit
MIAVENLKYQIGAFSLSASLAVGDGEYFVLLGMTGSGKTLFLENLCGLRTPVEGKICIKNRDVTFMEPRERNIGYVPQDGALFDNLDASGNIAFSLRVAGVSNEERKNAVSQTAALLGISHLLERKISGLSGGERQRVALARAIISRPDALFLDEPVSALDEHTRQAVCKELKKLQKNLKLSVIHICHSFEEAKLVADTIGIMHEGKIIQIGKIDEVAGQPSTLAVANILRLDNIFNGTAQNDGTSGKIHCNGITLYGPPAEGKIVFYIRPWEIEIVRENEKSENIIKGRISELNVAGHLAKITVEGALELTFYLSRKEALQRNIAAGETVALGFPANGIHILQG